MYRSNRTFECIVNLWHAKDSTPEGTDFIRHSGLVTCSLAWLVMVLSMIIMDLLVNFLMC